MKKQLLCSLFTASVVIANAQQMLHSPDVQPATPLLYNTDLKTEPVNDYTRKGKTDSMNRYLSNIYKLNAGPEGVSVGFEGRLSPVTTINLELGIGGNYSVQEKSYAYQWNFITPAYYFSVIPRYYYNIKKRAAKGKKTILNSGEFFGVKLKYASDDADLYNAYGSALLVNMHWGLQRAIGKRILFNTYVGVGYVKNNSSNLGMLCPSFDMKFALAFARQNNKKQ